MSLNVLKRIFGHRHKWKGTAWNPWMIAVEQKCKCGAYRHHFMEDLPKKFGGEKSWREGEHPVAIEMRARGISWK